MNVFFTFVYLYTAYLPPPRSIVYKTQNAPTFLPEKGLLSLAALFFKTTIQNKGMCLQKTR